MRSYHALLLATAAASGCRSRREPDGEVARAATAPGIANLGHETPPARPPARGPEHAVYSLVDNRLSAHVLRDGGLIVPAGSAGLAKYLRFGNPHKGRERIWELRRTDGGVRTAHMIGKTARLDVPLTAAQTDAPVVRVRVYSAKAEPFGVRVGGGAEISATAAAGWSTVELAVPRGELVPGENELVLSAKTAGHPVAWIEIGGARAPGDDPPSFYDAAANALVLPDRGGMAWYAFVPARARLTADVADRGCSVTVRATADDGATAQGALAGPEASVDLSALGGKAARVELTASGCAKATLAHAELMVPGEPAPAPARGAAPRHVVLFIMDSLRADRVRAFAPGARPETPEWDELAKTSAVFEQQYVQGNESRVSHASIWTSLYPVKHGFLDAYGSLSTKWKTVDAVAKDAGLYVAGVSANGYIQPVRGFGTAWNRFSNHIAEESGGLTAAEVIAHGLSFIDKKKRDPWFLYLGTIDTHVTWHAKQPWMAKYDPRPYSGRFAKSFDGDDADRAPGQPDPYGVVTEREREHVRALYDSNVSYQDDQLRLLVEKLQAWGVWEETLLIVTADHGDEQWEVDDRVGHGWSVRDMLVRVPLLVHYPPMIPAAKVDEGTEGIDIVPTIADALGVAADPEWQGASLIPLAGGVGRGYPRLSLASMFEDEHGPRLAQWKMDVRGASAPRLYDLAHDPGELKDLWGDGNAEIGARFVLDPTWMLRTFELDWKKARWGNAANVSARFASDLGE